MAVFWEYCRSLGQGNAVLLVVFFLLYQAGSVGSNVWLSQWTDDPDINNASIVNTTFYINKRNMYLGVYGGFGAIQGEFTRRNIMLFLP